MPHSAALLGRGRRCWASTRDATDHDFKPRVLLFLPEGETAPADLPADASVHTVRGYFNEQLGLDIDRELSVADWLTFPELLEEVRMWDRPFKVLWGDFPQRSRRL